jgi:NAD(P)-dependent dehydrogenase (short-subunit alcohol dehydrogenase family)
MALYVSSEHALEGYSESLDHEVRDAGTRVLLVGPAYTFKRVRLQAPATLNAIKVGPDCEQQCRADFHLRPYRAISFLGHHVDPACRRGSRASGHILS